MLGIVFLLEREAVSREMNEELQIQRQSGKMLASQS